MHGIDIIGFGPIGRDLATKLVSNKQLSDAFSITSISDSTGVMRPENRNEVLKIIEWKNAGGKLIDYKSRKKKRNRSKSSIVVDVTNSDYSKPEEAKKRAISTLGQGKHFVTASKVALAYYFSDILSYSKKRKLKVGYGAAICAGVHAINVALNLRADEIQSAKAVLNASTTMILSMLEEENSPLTFDAACKKAGESGVLESDWSIDLDGIDAAAKTSILANVLFPKKKISFREIARKGIRDEKAHEMIKVRKKEERVRLVSEITEGGARVEPQIVPRDSPLAVYGRFNVVSFETKNLGEISVRNLGGGVSLTSSVIISDLWKIAQ